MKDQKMWVHHLLKPDLPLEHPTQESRDEISAKGSILHYFNNPSLFCFQFLLQESRKMNFSDKAYTL